MPGGPPPRYFGERELLWARAAAIDGRRTVADPAARYASLMADTLRLAGYYVEVSYDSLLTRRIERTGALQVFREASEDACEQLDHAAVRLRLIRETQGPRTPLLAELYAEIERDLGPEHPALATVLEHAYMECREDERMTVCLSDRRRFERALELRERGLGPEHPLTQASRLNLAVVLVSAGAERRARELLAAIVRAPARDLSTVLARIELAWLEIRRDRWGPASRQLCEAARIAGRLGEARRERVLAETTAARCGHALAMAGLYYEALEVFRELWARDEAPDDPRRWGFPVAELLLASGEYAEAIAQYDRLLAVWLAETWRQESRVWIPRIYRRRAAAHEAMSRADLEQARAWCARGPRSHCSTQ